MKFLLDSSEKYLSQIGPVSANMTIISECTIKLDLCIQNCMGVESRKKKETFITAYFLVNNTPFPKCSNTDRNKVLQ